MERCANVGQTNHLLGELVGESVGHHGLPSSGWAVEQHHHTCPVSDGVIQPHSLAAAFVRLEVADCVQDQLLLFFGQNHLRMNE